MGRFPHVLGFMGLLATVGMSPANAASPTGPRSAASAPQRLIIAVDNSGSTMVGRRFGREVRAAKALVSALPVGSGITIELATASDRIDHLATIRLVGENDRESLLQRIDELQAIPTTTTRFRAVDDALDDLVRRRLLPNENIAVVLLTDGVSDDPLHDLRAEDLGDRVIGLEAGVIAVLAGNIPEASALSSSAGASKAAPPGRMRSGRASRLRQLFAPPQLVLTLPADVMKTLDRDLLNRTDPQTITFGIDVRGSLPRAIGLDVKAPPGATATVSPQVVSVTADGSAMATIVVQLQSEAARGALEVIARAPDGTESSSVIDLNLAANSYLTSNKLPLGGGAVCVLVLFFGFSLLGRRTVPLGVPGSVDKVARMRVGDRAPLATFEPKLALTAGEIVRGRFGWRVVAGDTEIVVGSRRVSPGASTTWEPGAPIKMGDALILLDVGATVAPTPGSYDLDMGSGGRFRVR